MPEWCDGLWIYFVLLSPRSGPTRTRGDSVQAEYSCQGAWMHLRGRVSTVFVSTQSGLVNSVVHRKSWLIIYLQSIKLVSHLGLRIMSTDKSGPIANKCMSLLSLDWGAVWRGPDHRGDGDWALGQIAVPGQGFQEDEWRHRAAALQHRGSAPALFSGKSGACEALRFGNENLPICS